MTEPVFKAPLPPQGNGFTPSSSPEPEEKKEPVTPEDIKQKFLPYLWYILGGTFAVGLIFGVMISGGESAPPPQRCRLVHIENPDIKGGFRLCGTVPPTEPCEIYMMNTTQYDKKVEDFFPEVTRLTERPGHLISLENPMYSKYLIKPGTFARIKVPSYR